MSKSGFLGSGLKFPVTADPGTGRISIAEGEESVRESLLLILMTNKGERPMSPDFGGNLMSYTFMDASSTMLHLLKNDLTSLILRQEPRIEDVNVEIDSMSREGCLLLSIDYKTRSSNIRGNLVFPFYVKIDKKGGYDEAVEV